MLYFVETGPTNYLNYLSKGRLTKSDRPCRTDVKPTGEDDCFQLDRFCFCFLLVRHRSRSIFVYLHLGIDHQCCHKMCCCKKNEKKAGT